MTTLLHEIRRAPARLLATITALALAAAATGVLSIPAVSAGTLHAIAAADGLADITLATSPLVQPSEGDGLVRQIETLDGVSAADLELDVGVTLSDGRTARLVGVDFASQRMDRLRLEAGRLPASEGEVVTSSGFAKIGDTLAIRSEMLRVVGNGGTLWWSDQVAIYGQLDDALSIAGVAGPNRLVITATNDDMANLQTIAGESRSIISANGAMLTDFPVYLPDGTTPIDDDIHLVSQMIGMLGIVAGIVALVLLGSTTNTLIVERSLDTAVLRALGTRSRPLRRRLRRLATMIVVTSLAIGLPLGVVVSNVIARMVLERFVGITPDVGVDWKVIAATVLAAVIGGRLVSTRAARRVTRLPLVDALRDREGKPFGNRRGDRLIQLLPVGGLWSRLALRSMWHQRSRSIAITAQIAAGVGAAVIVATLVTSISTFNVASKAPWSWDKQAAAIDPGLTIDARSIETPGLETGISTYGEVAGWDVEVYGLEQQTTIFDPMLDQGRWIRQTANEAVISRGLARYAHLDVGGTIEVELATGPQDYSVVGVANDHGSALYLDRHDLANDLGTPNGANRVWSTDERVVIELPGTEVVTADERAADDEAARRAILAIFGTIGAILAGVAGLAVASMLIVNLHDSQTHHAVLRATGARDRRVHALVLRQLLPLAVVGLALGFVGGQRAARAIIGVFEAADAVDIGVDFSPWSIPLIAGPTLIGLFLLSGLTLRTSARRSIAATLRAG